MNKRGTNFFFAYKKEKEDDDVNEFKVLSFFLNRSKSGSCECMCLKINMLTLSLSLLKIECPSIKYLSINE